MTMKPADRYAAREKIFSASEWTALVGSTPGFSLLQSWEYGKAKAETGPWRLRHLLIEEAGRPVAAAQVMLRDLPLIRGGLAWCNRGPILLDASEPEPERLAGILRAMVGHWAAERGYYLRLAPPWSEGTRSSEARAAGLEAAGRRGWASARLDLSEGIEALRAGLRKNWRSALINAEKNALEWRSGEREFPTFIRGYDEFLKERDFATPVTAEFLSALQAILPPERKFRVLVAGPEAAPIAGVLVARLGDTAEYLAAFRNADGNRRNAGQFLLWRAICGAREDGARWFDLGGMDPALTLPGIMKFKEGVGAAPYRLADEVEAAHGLAARLVRWKVRRTV